MAQIVSHLETNCGLTLESLMIGDKQYDREAIETKQANQLHYLQVLIDAGIAPEYTRQSVASVGDDVPLL